MTDCPQAEQFRAYLSDALAPSRSDALEEHVETCSRCRDTLAALTLGTEANRRPPPATTQNWRPGRALIARLESHSFNGLTVGPARHLEDDSPVLPTIPGYEILRVLGRGGMGVVYEAVQLGLNRRVALKMLRGVDAQAADLTRFRREAEAVARLTHANIVQVYETGESGGVPYFTLELVEGGTLAERSAGRPIPPQEAAELVETLARAVHHAHGAGIVHRDLKPGNVLLAAGGLAAPKIADFGLARRLDLPSEVTRSGDVVGTPSYMAPEQARGQGNRVGPAADVYGLGAILYELLTGRPPFTGATPLDIVMHLLADEPVSVRRLVPEVRRDLETICLTCLEKEPRRRYASAEALAEDLRRFRSGEAIRARPVSALERSWKWARRRPVMAGLIALSLTLAVGVFAAVLVGWVESDRLLGRVQAARDDERDQRLLADQRAEERRLALLDADRNLYSYRVSVAARDAAEGRLDRARRVLERCPEALRGWEWHHLHGVTHFEGFRLGDPRSEVALVAMAPDGRRYATADPVRGQPAVALRLWDANGPRELAEWHGVVKDVRQLLFLDGGRRLALLGEDPILTVWDVETKAVVHTTPALPKGRPSRIAIGPDLNRPLPEFVAVGTTDGALLVWETATGREVLTAPGAGVGVAALGIGAYDQRPVLAASIGGDAKVAYIAPGESFRTLRGSRATVRSLAFTTNRKALLTGDDEGTIRRWDLSNGRETMTVRGHEVPVHQIAVGSDDLTFATGDATGAAKLWFAANGRFIRTVHGHDRAVAGLWFAPNGRLVSADPSRAVRVWDADDRPNRYLFHERIGPGSESRGIGVLAFHPDAVRFAAGNRDGLRIWDATTGQTVREWAKINAGEVAFDRTGSRLACTIFSGNQVRVLDVDGDAPTVVVEGLSIGVAPGVAFAPDGSLATFDADGTLAFWNPATGKPLARRKLASTRIVQCAFANDGSTLAVLAKTDQPARNEVTVWNVSTGAEVGRWTIERANPYPVALAFLTPDQLAVSVADPDDLAIAVRDVRTGATLRTLVGHTHRIRQLAAFPDGRRLVSQDSYTIRLWDATNGHEMMQLQAVGRNPTAVTVAPNGRRIVGGDGEGSVRIWAGTPADE